MRIALNSVLLFSLLLLIAANVVLRPNHARSNYEFLPQMAHSPRYNAFAANPNFPDYETLRVPPPGTIPRGFLPLHYAASAQDAIRAGNELQSPIDLNAQQARERGATLFAHYCVVCHGAGGLGNGTVTQRGFPPPPSLLAKHALDMQDGQMFHALTFGQNNMPSYASQLSREDRWNVIAYVRVLQAQAPSSREPKTRAVAMSAAADAISPGGKQ